jgi:hypothetical protein
MEGRIEVTGRRGRRSKQLLHDVKEKRGYWKLKKEDYIVFLGELAVEETTNLS